MRHTQRRHWHSSTPCYLMGGGTAWRPGASELAGAGVLLLPGQHLYPDVCMPSFLLPPVCSPTPGPSTLRYNHSQPPTTAPRPASCSKRGVLLDITSLPDAEALTRAERNLCATERYLPAQYLAVKAAALRLQDQKGRVSRQDVTRMPFQVDEQRMAR